MSAFAISVGVNGGTVYRTLVSVTGTATGPEIYMAFENDTGFEQKIGQVFKTSTTSRVVTTNGALGDAVATCGLLGLTDPFRVRFQSLGISGGECPETADDAPVWQRLVALSPQFYIPNTEDMILAQGQTLAWTPIMEGPPNTTMPNTTISAYFGMNKPNQQGWITFEMDVANANPLSGSGGFTMAHIHAGNSSTSIGPVVVDLIPMRENWPTPTITDGDSGLVMLDPPVLMDRPVGFQGAFNSDQFLGPLQGKTMDEFVELVEAGSYYVNVHTTEYPAGAVRAQLMTMAPGPTPGPTTRPHTGSGP